MPRCVDKAKRRDCQRVSFCFENGRNLRPAGNQQISLLEAMNYVLQYFSLVNTDLSEEDEKSRKDVRAQSGEVNESAGHERADD